ncbi:hypothetical protein Poli38472_011594 [Pythium oligandrum]|uniref:Bromo domain-containing protein n=1 Tax=Pythium oligandrum TaxID=41045 RepID=A0A8K1CKF9_PYTOL|nr:hypothetical protein Poli38472_011594 [Pythium oligandrum]|eukprot:TMW64714.1 hypothetical protein Poli38472_011594 [Pythium oligandrum]
MMEEVLYRKCMRLHERLAAHELSYPFLEPVDPVVMNLPTYFDIIQSPMDLSTMYTKLTTGQYDSPDDYRDDMVLMFENAIEFNKGDTHEDSVGEMAKRLLAYGMHEWERTFSEDATTDWQQVTLEQVEDQLMERARDAKMIQRWKQDSFVVRMNREKREQRQAMRDAAMDPQNA